MSVTHARCCLWWSLQAELPLPRSGIASLGSFLSRCLLSRSLAVRSSGFPNFLRHWFSAPLIVGTFFFLPNSLSLRTLCMRDIRPSSRVLDRFFQSRACGLMILTTGPTLWPTSSLATSCCVLWDASRHSLLGSRWRCVRCFQSQRRASSCRTTRVPRITPSDVRRRAAPLEAQPTLSCFQLQHPPQRRFPILRHAGL